MRLLLAFAVLAAAPPGNEETFKAELGIAIQNFDRYAADKASAGLAKCNTEGVAPALAAAYHKGLVFLLDYEKQRKKWAREMVAHETLRDKSGKLIQEGDSIKWIQARKEFNAFMIREETMNALLPRVLGNMSKISSPEAARGAIEVLKTDDDWVARAYAAEALGNIDDPAALKALLDAGRAEKAESVKVAISDALGRKSKGSEDARKLLMDWLSTSTLWQVRLASAQALTASGDKSVVLPLITAIAKERGRMKWEINDGLKKLTRVDKSGDPAAWKSWWDKFGDDFLFGNYQPGPLDGQEKRTVTSFYGLRLNSEHVAFLVDVSASMNETAQWKSEFQPGEPKPEGDRRIDIARYELKRAINGLPDNAEFSLVRIGSKATPIRGQLLRSGAGSRGDAISFMNQTEVTLGTDIFGAFRKAFEWTGGAWNAPLTPNSLDTLYLISDGDPTVGLTDRPQLVERVIDTFHFKKVLVHCVAISPPGHGVLVLKGISDGTRGDFIRR